jgi:hypothetical protein
MAGEAEITILQFARQPFRNLRLTKRQRKLNRPLFSPGLSLSGLHEPAMATRAGKFQVQVLVPVSFRNHYAFGGKKGIIQGLYQ